MSDFEYFVGDSFEGGPIELQKYIMAILGVGGEFEYTGNTVTITKLPNQPEVAAVEVVEEVPEAQEAPEVEEAPVQDLSPAEDLAAVEEAVTEAPAPKRGRKPSIKAEPVEVTE